MKSILDRSFSYTPSYATDLKRRFEKMQREEQAAAKARREARARSKANRKRRAIRTARKVSPLKIAA